jgi:hypothetical protein
MDSIRDIRAEADGQSVPELKFHRAIPETALGEWSVSLSVIFIPGESANGSPWIGALTLNIDFPEVFEDREDP